MEGRHCFGHLTVEENLLTGAFTRRDGNAAIKRDIEMVYTISRACASADKSGRLHIRRRTADDRDRPGADEPAER
jgi:ABC-type branched-subunit amino acid transport system ATPase component